MNNPAVIGLIAAGGRLPVMVASDAKKAGLKVICVGIGDGLDNELFDFVDVFHRVPVARCGAWIRKLRRHNVSKTIMVGKIEKTKIYTPFRILKYIPDWRAFRVWYVRLRKKDKRADTLLKALAEELASGGIVLEDSTMYSKKQLAENKVMTKKQPSSFISGDVEFGWEIARKIGEVDIGQAVVVRETETVAVEAIEGTSAMIERAGKLCGTGWTLVKVSKPNQDMRFDVPCIGPDTVSSVSENGGKCIAIEACKTFIIDKEETIALADKLGIVIIGK